MSVEFTTKVPSATFPLDIAGIWIVPPKAWDAAGSETAFARAPIGSGPYMVTSWDDNQVTMAANKKSWRYPLADGLVFTAIGDEAARLSALMSGGIDMSVQTSPDAIASIEQAGGRVLVTPGGTVGTIALNAMRAGSPFADRRVRQAVNYAVNKYEIGQVLFHGTANAMSQPASPITAGYDATILPYPYDPVRARALLAEAGFPDGFELTIEVGTNALPADAATFSAVARDLTAVGVRTTVRSLPLPILFERLFKNTNEGLGFQLGFISMPQLDTVKAMADFNCDKPGSGGPFICIAELQMLVEQARRELDPVKRNELLLRINRLAHDEALALFLVDGVDLIATGPRLMGDAPTTRFYHWENFSLLD
jgi:peptide/nickel transport system substrate-binding protein